MIVLSLFDGISCGQLALKRAGIPVEAYFASEIDNYAKTITQTRFPNTYQIGDVTKIDWTPFIGKVDLLIGGSPCQDLSIAKKGRKGLDGERSGLFWKYVEALNTIKPKYFLLENVASMTKENKDIITKALGVEPILINSALVSAQQRKRLYWTNIPNVTQLEDKGIILEDIIENGIVDRDKAYCVDASYWKGTNLDSYMKKKKRQTKFISVNTAPVRLGQLKDGRQWDRIYSVKGKSVSLNGNGGGLGANTGLYKLDLPDGDYIISKLTPLECERLQTLPDGYTKVDRVSNTQRYKCIGNGWTVDVIAHIFKGLKEENNADQ